MNRKANSRRALLLQVRNLGDPILPQELDCFAQAMGWDSKQLTPINLLEGFPSEKRIAAHHCLLVGGSGDYSVTDSNDWVQGTLDGLRWVAERSIPSFLSCWGFQAMALALGGEVMTDLSRAELGSLPIIATSAAEADPLFAPLGDQYPGLLGHQDIVDRLGDGMISLARSDRVPQQAFVLQDKPIYGTQFHPELTLPTFLDRIRAYPKYVESIAGVPFEVFAERCEDTPEANGLLRRFVELF